MKASTDNETKRFNIKGKLKTIFQGQMVDECPQDHLIFLFLSQTCLGEVHYKISQPKVYKIDRFVYNCLLQLINLEIQIAF